MEQEKQTFVQLKSFLSGGFGGICLVFAGHPLDLIKVKLQTGDAYKSTLDAFKNIARTEGLRGLYRGMTAPLIGITPIFAVNFWGYAVGKQIVSYDQPGKELSLGRYAIAGGLSAIPMVGLMAPFERIKVVMQVQKDGSQLNSPWRVVKHLFKEGGVRSIFRGSFATLMRDVPGSMAYFSTYEGIKRALSAKGELNPVAVVCAGGMAGIANWIFAIPADVIKSRLQSAPKGTYTSTAHCFRHLVQTEGYSALFKGLQPAIIRAFPANAACFLGVEISLSIMNKLF